MEIIKYSKITLCEYTQAVSRTAPIDEEFWNIVYEGGDEEWITIVDVMKNQGEIPTHHNKLSFA